ncbi:MAG TPA: hypothetical protein VGK64_20775 [Bryobacteraceae bacterium]
MTPDSLTGIAGDSASLEGYEEDISCYGSLLDYYPRTPTWDTWQCDNTSVAAVDQNGTATALGFGNTTIHDLFFAATYYADAGDECHENDFTADASAGCDVLQPADPATCTILVRGTGSKTSGDNLSFPSGDQTLGAKNLSDRWIQQVEISGTVSDDASNWALHQKYSGLLKDGRTQQLSVPNDDPDSSFRQQPAGQKNFFWIDGPGYRKISQNFTQVQNFTSWAQQGNSICRTTWHLKIVVSNGALTQQSYDTGFISTR